MKNNQEIVNQTVQDVRDEVELRIFELMRTIKREKNNENYQEYKENDLTALKTYETILNKLDEMIEE